MIYMPHLETDITQACQLSCVACNHHVPIWRHFKGGPWAADVVQVEKDLNALSKIMHAKAWGALGGEPLLHSKLEDILHVARDSGVSDIIEVWTNGLALPKKSAAFWRAFDVLVLSLYPGKHTVDSINWITEKCKDEGVSLVIKDEQTSPNFRTLLEIHPTTPEQTKFKYDRFFFRNFSRVANNGYFFTCCCSPHMPMLLQNKEFGTDGIKISTLTKNSLSAYLSQSAPLGACTICAGRDTAVPITWKEEKDPYQWIRLSAGLV